MNQNVKLKMAKFPKLLGELAHSNQFLKVFSFASLTLTLMALIILCVWASKAPQVLTLAPTGEALGQVELPTAENQIRSAVRSYLEKRYKWDPATVKKKLNEAQAFVLPASLRAYQGAVANVAKFSIEKLVSQRVYPEKIEVNLEKKTVVISGDRVTSIQGLKAAGNLQLELTFDSGPRTKENPWGLYITKEREE